MAENRANRQWLQRGIPVLVLAAVVVVLVLVQRHHQPTSVASAQGEVVTYVVNYGAEDVYDEDNGGTFDATCQANGISGCTLRAAIQTAQSPDNEGKEVTITFAPEITDIYLQDTLIVTRSMTIIGHGSSGLTVTLAYNSANPSIIDAGFPYHNFFTIDYPHAYPSFQVDISGMNLVFNNGDSQQGGVIHTTQTLSMSDVIINGPRVDLVDGGVGGAFYNTGTLSLTHITINSPRADDSGGAIHNEYGTLAASDMTINGCYATLGGALYNFDAEATLDDVTITNCTADSGGAIYSDATSTLTIQNSQIGAQGAPNRATLGSGGGIYNEGTLDLSNVFVLANETTQANIGHGGGIYNQGTTTVFSSTISYNTSAASGGGFYTTDAGGGNGTLSLTGAVTVTHNQAQDAGGGIYNTSAAGESGQVDITDSTISDNEAVTYGGAIYNDLGEEMTLTRCRVERNTTTGFMPYGSGIYNNGSVMAIHSSTIDSNIATGAFGFGGGVYNDTDGVATIKQTTLSNNVVPNAGGGLYNDGNMSVANSTISSNEVNSSSSFGGGTMNVDGTLTITQSTVVNNTAQSGGGVYNEAGTVSVGNTILAFNEGGSSPDMSENVVSNGYNVISPTAQLSLHETDVGVTDPLIGPLADNGGPTLTHMLLRGSPAINAVGSKSCGLSSDQRGLARPQGSACDIGAVEKYTEAFFDPAAYQMAEDGGTITLTVKLDFAPTQGEVTLHYTTANGTARAGRDYTAVQGTLTFSPSQTIQSIGVPLLDDSFDEDAETFSVSLDTSSNNALVGTPYTATVTIDDDDVPIVAFGLTHFSIVEGDDTGTLTATLNITSTREISATYTTSDGTATAGSDYTAISGTLTFAPGQLVTTLGVPIIDDADVEPDETLNVVLSNPSSYAQLGTQVGAILTILDNEVVPSAQFGSSAYRVREDTGTLTMTVTLDVAPQQPATLYYATTNGTAIGGQDFVPISGTLTITYGVTTIPLNVPIIYDRIYEQDETFGLVLSNPSTYLQLGAPMTTTVTIENAEIRVYIPITVK